MLDSGMLHGSTKIENVQTITSLLRNFVHTLLDSYCFAICINYGYNVHL